MESEDIAALDVDCETGTVTLRILTPDERALHHQQQVRTEVVADLLAERTALATWIAGQSTLPEAARNALARATGVTLPGGTG
jgi:hypothetical protein